MSRKTTCFNKLRHYKGSPDLQSRGIPDKDKQMQTTNRLQEQGKAREMGRAAREPDGVSPAAKPGQDPRPVPSRFSKAMNLAAAANVPTSRFMRLSAWVGKM